MTDHSYPDFDIEDSGNISEYANRFGYYDFQFHNASFHSQGHRGLADIQAYNCTLDVQGHDIVPSPWATFQPYRGTYDILWSCVMTVTMGIYTVLHLDVPREGKRRSLPWRSVRWSLLACLAPELLLVAAWYVIFRPCMLRIHSMD